MTKKETVSLSKFLAQAGVASRRKVVDIIKDGNVKVGSSVITQPGHKITPQDKVFVFGKLIIPQKKVYILMNKPKDCVTTVSDEKGRLSVIDLLGPAVTVRVYPVGRLDRNTTGVLLLTNDGDLTQKLAHPKFQVEKTYHALLDKTLTDNDMKKIKAGVKLFDGIVDVDGVFFVPGKRHNHVMLSLHSGRNRVVRRLFEALGYDIRKLDRVKFAGLTKRGLARGKWRFLTAEEIQFLQGLGS